MSNVHKVVETTPVEIQVDTSHSTCIGVSEPRNTKAEDNSDWDEEPDKSLVDTYNEEAARPSSSQSTGKCLEKTVDGTSDLVLGRVYRKRTAPTPVTAPKKRKVSTQADTVVNSQTMERKVVEIKESSTQIGEPLKDEEAQTEMVNVVVQESVDKGGHICEICKITFEDIRMYMVHESSHSRDDPWRCRVCG